MKTVVNVWGTEGFLSAYALTALACLGVFPDSPDGKEKINIRYIDFKTNDLKLAGTYNKYYSKVFGKSNILEFENITLDLNGSVSDKFNETEILSLGFSENDLFTELDGNIYGKQWLGEIYFSDVCFERLYKNLPDEDFILINCGGCTGGAPASVFIPVESVKHINGRRYNVLCGPSAYFCYKVKIPHPDIYSENISEFPEISIFDIPEVTGKMKQQAELMKSDIFSVNDNTDFIMKNEKNIRVLEKEYNKVISEKYDLRSLAPEYNIGHFVEAINFYGFTSYANFINIKTDGKNFLPYDVNSDRFAPDVYEQKADITNLLNALSITEIIKNHNRYMDGKIYGFGAKNAEKYTPDILFDSQCRRHFAEFMIFSVIITGYVHRWFSGCYDSEYIKIVDKWKKKSDGFLGGLKSLFSSRGKFTEEDKIFERIVRKNTEDFIKEYICGVTGFFLETDYVSEQSCVMKNELNDIFSAMYKHYSENNSTGIFQIDVKESITDILRIVCHISPDKLNGFLVDYLEKYRKDFPEFNNRTASETDAVRYSEKIIRYTMSRAEELTGRL